MESDKRRFVRKRTDQLLYAEFGPDNGSILLNLSEDGCSFQSIAPVREKELAFTFSVGDGRRVSGTGRMVWSEPSRKTGGLRFLDPSPELREQVREWLNATLVTADGKLDPAAAESEAKRRRKKLREEARLEALRAQKAAMEGPAAAQVPFGTAVASPLPVQTGAELLLRAESPNRTPARAWRVGAGLLLLVILLATLGAYRRELGHVLVSFGSSLAGEDQKASPALNGVPAALPVSATAAPRALPTKQQSQQNAEVTAIPTSSEQDSRVSIPSASRKSEGMTSANPDDTQSLWNQVETGDTNAELALADRYIRGEGVTPSCAQARVLLEAAAKRGSTEARRKLGELAQSGCQ